jgi:hypothetical protein
MKRDRTCVQGQISKVDAKVVTIQTYKKPPISIQREDLLQVRQGDALVFSAVSSWSDVMVAHVIPHEAFVLKTRSGKVVKGVPSKVTQDSITLKQGLITIEYSKAEIIVVDYLRVKPADDTYDYFVKEGPELLFLFPETYYRLMGLEGRVPVRLFDASKPEAGAVLQCSSR